MQLKHVAENIFTIGIIAVLYKPLHAATDSILIGTCEYGTSRNEVGADWYWYTDRKYGGISKILNEEASYDSATNSYNSFVPTKNEGNIYGTRGYGAHATFDLKNSNGYNVFGGVGLELCAPGSVCNLYGLDSIQFWAKAERDSLAMSLAVMFLTESVEDYAYHQCFVDLTREWKKYTVAVRDLSQDSWGEEVLFDPAKMQRISFHITGQCTVKLWVDDVVMYRNTGGEVLTFNGKRIVAGKTFTVVPGANALTVVVPATSTTTDCYVFSMLGKSCFSQKLSATRLPIQTTITIPHLTPGQYLFIMSNPALGKIATPFIQR